MEVHSKRILNFYIFWKECHDRDINKISTFCFFQHFAFPFPDLNAPEIWLKQAFAISFFIELTLKSIGKGDYELLLFLADREFRVDIFH